MSQLELAASPSSCVAVALVVILGSLCWAWYTVVVAEVRRLDYHLVGAEVQLDRRLLAVEEKYAGMNGTIRDMSQMYWRSLASVGTALESAHKSDLEAEAYGGGVTGGGVFFRDKRNRELELAAEILLVAPLPGLRAQRQVYREDPLPNWFDRPAVSSGTTCPWCHLAYVTM